MERRAKPRLQVAAPIDLVLVGTNQNQSSGWIANISESGVGVRLREPFNAGDTVRMEVEDQVFVGTIVHCEPQSGEYYAGIELTYSMTRDELDEFVMEWGLGKHWPVVIESPEPTAA